MPETLFHFESGEDAICVLDSDAVCARDEAALRMEVEMGECRLVETEEVASFEDFLERYSVELPRFGYEETLGLATDWLTAEEVSGFPAERCWTVLDCDGVFWLASGFHFVNRVGYLVTREEHGFEMRDYAVA